MSTEIVTVKIEMRIEIRGDFPRAFEGEAALAAQEYVDRKYPDEGWAYADIELVNYDRYIVRYEK